MGCGAAGSLQQYGHRRVRRVRKGPANEQEIDSTTALRSEFLMVKPSCVACSFVAQRTLQQCFLCKNLGLQ